MPVNGPSYAPEFRQQQQQSQPNYQTQYRRPERQNLQLDRPQAVEEPSATPREEVSQPVGTPPTFDLGTVRERFRQGINVRPEE
jgi:hypothetical protein